MILFDNQVANELLSPQAISSAQNTSVLYFYYHPHLYIYIYILFMFLYINKLINNVGIFNCKVTIIDDCITQLNMIRI